MTEVWYARIADTALAPALATWLARLPPAWQQRVLSRRRPASRLGSLFGALLLQRVLARQPRPYSLAQVQRTPDHRPYLPGAGLDFNLSHAGHYVACALSYAGRVGLDLEQHRPGRPLAGFAPHFTPAEWAAYQAAPDPLAHFYGLWTQKEAVAKADGRGLNLPLRAIELLPGAGLARLAGTPWHLHELALAPGYSLHLASARPTPAPRPQLLELD